MQSDERALGRARSQRFRDNDKLKKINERFRKYTTIKLMRGDAPGSSVPLATYSASTEEAIVMRPARRSLRRWDVSHEYTENVLQSALNFTKINIFIIRHSIAVSIMMSQGCHNVHNVTHRVHTMLEQAQFNDKLR